MKHALNVLTKALNEAMGERDAHFLEVQRRTANIEWDRDSGRRTDTEEVRLRDTAQTKLDTVEETIHDLVAGIQVIHAAMGTRCRDPQAQEATC